MVFINVYCYPVSSGFCLFVVIIWLTMILDIIDGFKQHFILDYVFLKRRDRVKSIGSATGCMSASNIFLYF